MHTLKRVIPAVLFALALAGRACAQHWFPEVDLRSPGDVVWQTSVEADLNRDFVDKQYKIVLLPPEYTVQGFRWEVEYEAVRTKATWPNWHAAMRIDVPSASGQVFSRVHQVNVVDPVTGTWVFHGENHAEGRPHRLRFTFGQPASFPYWVRATIRARRAPTANIGGSLRETPDWVRVGNTASPSWLNGDVRVNAQHHRWMLMSLEPGQELRVKSRFGEDLAQGGALSIGMWNMDHRLLGTLAVMIGASTNDVKLRVNTTGQRQWYFVSLYCGGWISSFELGFYSPQGSSPPVGTTVTLPSAAELNPYEVVARDVQSWQGPAGSNYAMDLPGTGEMLRLRVRVLKTPWLGGGTAPVVTVTIYAQDGTTLATRSFTTHAYGLDYSEYYYELDDTTAANRLPVRIELKTIYAAHDLVADATRYRRTR